MSSRCRLRRLGLEVILIVSHAVLRMIVDDIDSKGAVVWDPGKVFSSYN